MLLKCGTFQLQGMIELNLWIRVVCETVQPSMCHEIASIGEIARICDI